MMKGYIVFFIIIMLFLGYMVNGAMTLGEKLKQRTEIINQVLEGK